MKHYETIFIINPNLGDEEYGEVLTKIRDLIDKLKGVIVKVEEWGKQKLAYQLMKFGNGFYVLIDYCGEPGMTVEMERNLKLDERVLKYQTIKLADKSDPEALIRKEKENAGEAPAKAGEAPAKAGEAPAKAGEAPAKAEEAPAKAEEAPAKAEEAPAKATEVPMEEGPQKATETTKEAENEEISSKEPEGFAEAGTTHKNEGQKEN